MICALVSMVLCNIAGEWPQDLLFCDELQVDQHVEALDLVCMGQEDLALAGQLARNVLRPKRLTLRCRDTDRSSSAITALLATEQHDPLFKCVQWLTFGWAFPQDLPQVSVLLRQPGTPG
jgi:hypothetical protein